jgi:hypothetical protein
VLTIVQKMRVKKGFSLNQQQKTIVDSFEQEVARNPEGISAEKEKFIHGMKTDSHKVLPSNRND